MVAKRLPLINPHIVRNGRESLWAVLVEQGLNKPFDPQLAFKYMTPADRKDIKRYIEHLTKAGYMKADGDSFVMLRLPRLAPRFDKNGQEFITQQQMLWNAVRRLKHWTVKELAGTASLKHKQIKPTSASRYVKRLTSAGYIQVIDNKGSKPWVFRLKPSMNTGPDCPKIYNISALYDPNKRVIYGETPASEVAL